MSSESWLQTIVTPFNSHGHKRKWSTNYRRFSSVRRLNSRLVERLVALANNLSTGTTAATQRHNHVTLVKYYL
jgi:hypothetical protein